MLDNVVEINGLPLPQQRNEILRKRRHGMGFLGLGSTITMLRMKYGEPAPSNSRKRLRGSWHWPAGKRALSWPKKKGRRRS